MRAVVSVSLVKPSPLALALALLGACASSSPSGAPVDAAVTDGSSLTDASAGDASAPADAPYSPSPLIAARPYMQRVPSSYDPARPMPLVILLHGYGAGGMVQAGYLNLLAATASEGFLLAYPDGTVDESGRRFWNATDGCCDFGGTQVDDVAYVDAVIDDMRAQYNVDPRRIFLIGHSNGGFMAHRYACERAGRIAGIVSLAGAAWADPSRCAPSRPVSVLQVHGTADDVIRFNGGRTPIASGGPYPAARDSVGQWRAHNGCGALAATGETMDLERTVAGAETRVERAEMCRGGGAELWVIEGGGHIPSFGPEWTRALGRWMAAHPAP